MESIDRPAPGRGCVTVIAAGAVLATVVVAGYLLLGWFIQRGTYHRSREECERWRSAYRLREAVLDALSPGIRCSGRTGYEAAVIGNMRTLATAQALFREGDKDGNGVLDYAASLADLERVRLIAPGSFERTGYAFTLLAGTTTWSATAVPSCPLCTKGCRSFFVDETGVIRFSTTGPAGRASVAIGG